MQQGNANFNAYDIDIERELAARKGESYVPHGAAAPQRAPSGMNPNAQSGYNPNAAARAARPMQESRPTPSAVARQQYPQPVAIPAQSPRNAAQQNTVVSPVPDATAVYRNAPAARSAGSEDYTRVHQPARPQNSVKRSAGSNSAPRSGGGRSGGGRSGGNKNAGGKGGSGGGRKPGSSKSLKRKARKIVFYNILKAAGVLFCVAVIVGSMLAVMLARYLVEATAEDDLILNLETRKYAQTGYILAHDPATGEWMQYQKLVSESNRIWVALDKIPDNLVDAVISTEDREFETHGGFSVKRTLFAAFNEVFHVRDNTFGASTINQQLVKNLTGEKEVVGEDGSREAGYKRKAREIYRAVWLDNHYSKDMILEAYLNTLPLSGTIVGVQAAAKEYFYKDVGDLELHEAAMIAGITQAPGAYNPFTHPDNCLVRRNDVLYFMWQNGTITEQEMEAAAAKPLGLYEGTRQEDQFATNTGVTSYFTDTVFEEVVADLVEKGIVETREAAVDYYYNSGLRIESTVDLTLQAEMERVYELGWDEGGVFPADVTAETEVTNADGSVSTQTVHPQSAMAVMDYTGALRGIVGGLGEKKESLGLNRAYQSPRPIGSTMKPLTAYALGIDYDMITYSTSMWDAAVSSRNPANPTRDAEGNIVPDWPYNYGEKASRNENVLVIDAVAQSKNTVPALIGTWLGQERMFEFLRDTLGISSLVDTGADNDHNYAPLVLGALTRGITAYELAAAYAIFGGTDSYGVYTSPRCYERVLDANGNVILQADQITTQAVSPETGYIVNRLLSNVLRISGGTARGMALNYMDSVAKTGTTTDDKDRWFVGLTPYYVSTVWWGYDTNEELQWSAAAATNPPPNVWKTVMETVQANLPEIAFPEAPETVVARNFCRDSGLIASENCPNTQTGYYNAENIPEVCTLHTAGAEA